jgi:hypothetical protein
MFCAIAHALSPVSIADILHAAIFATPARFGAKQSTTSWHDDCSNSHQSTTTAIPRNCESHDRLTHWKHREAVQPRTLRAIAMSLDFSMRVPTPKDGVDIEIRWV